MMKDWDISNQTHHIHTMVSTYVCKLYVCLLFSPLLPSAVLSLALAQYTLVVLHV